MFVWTYSGLRTLSRPATAILPKSFINKKLGLRRLSLLLIIDAGSALGRLAQWLERLVHTEEVGGSNPPSPTIT